MDVGFKTDKGVLRRNNEDAFFVMKKDGIFIVADGVGGASSGEVASHTAVNEVMQFVEEQGIGDNIPDSLLRAMRVANFHVYDLAQRHVENRGMATTMVLAYVHDGHLTIGNVGDSRAYLVRNESIEQITEDHTYVNLLIKAGVISKEEAEHHEHKHSITKAIGAESELEPDFYDVPLQAGDKIILCTDGLYGEVGEEEMLSILGKGESMTQTCIDFVDHANQNGGGDNITVICIEIMEEDIA